MGSTAVINPDTWPVTGKQQSISTPLGTRFIHTHIYRDCQGASSSPYPLANSLPLTLSIVFSGNRRVANAWRHIVKQKLKPGPGTKEFCGKAKEKRGSKKISCLLN